MYDASGNTNWGHVLGAQPVTASEMVKFEYPAVTSLIGMYHTDNLPEVYKSKYVINVIGQQIIF